MKGPSSVILLFVVLVICLVAGAMIGFVRLAREAALVNNAPPLYEEGTRVRHLIDGTVGIAGTCLGTKCRVHFATGTTVWYDFEMEVAP